MKIVNEILCLPSVFLLFALAACTTMESPTLPVITPITYRLPESQIARSIGRLRRLAIAPVRSWRPVGLLGPVFGPSTFKEGDENTKHGLLSNAISFLADADWKGYEVVRIDSHDASLQRRLRLSAEEIARHLNALSDWPIESGIRKIRRKQTPRHATNHLSLIIQHTPKAMPPPTNMDRTASAIGRALNVDGLVIIQGVGPLWDLFGRKDLMFLRADIYEVSSGKVVWTNEVVDAPIERAAEMLFDSLEPAIPKVLVDEKQ